MLRLLFVTLLVSVSIKDIHGQGCGCKNRKLMRRDTATFQLGDMFLDVMDVGKIQGYKANYANSKKWAGNKLLFSFAGNFQRDKMELVRTCLSELQKDLGGCVKFEESTKGHYVQVNSGSGGCHSALGSTDGQNQLLNLESPGCLSSKGTIKHEFMHALGFMHTHMRKDRDQHIKILWDKIQTSYCSQFVICEGCELGGPYETNSVMHYPSYGFACKQGENVVLKKDGGFIDYNHVTTNNDINMIKTFYKC